MLYLVVALACPTVILNVFFYLYRIRTNFIVSTIKH